MAGYLISLDSVDSLHLYTRTGVYGTKLSAPGGSWMVHHEGTFADYATMQPDDNVYFFIRRKIYGIGRLVRIGADCKYFNYPEAGVPEPSDYHKVQESLLWDEGPASADQRCVCFFQPDPHFFALGIDMDDVLASNPAAFKMLRAFWKLSFVRFDDEENQAFRDIILKRHQAVLATAPATLPPDSVFPFAPDNHRVIERLGTANYSLDTGIKKILAASANGAVIRHEMAVEAGILHQLASQDSETVEIFGQWDYVSHQVVASPFKPVDYMDKMDLFGYSFIPGYRPTKAQFLVGEIKKDAAKLEDVDQLLKYVDWVRDEYCYGDYSMIRAFLVASHFDATVIDHATQVGTRNYTVGVRPAQSQEWRDLHLVKYSYQAASEKLQFVVAG